MDHANHPVRPLIVDDNEESGISRGTWLFIASMVLAKIAVIGAVFAIEISNLSALYVIVTTWLWVIVAAVLLAGPITYQLRIRRVRARRAELERSEWLVDELSAEEPRRANPHDRKVP